MFSHIRQDNPPYRVQAGPLLSTSPTTPSWLTSRPQSSGKLPPAFTLISFPVSSKQSDSLDLPTARRPSWPNQPKPQSFPSSDGLPLPSTRPHYIIQTNDASVQTVSVQSKPATEIPLSSDHLPTWFSWTPAPSHPWPPASKFIDTELSTNQPAQAKTRRSKGHHKKRHGAEDDDTGEIGTRSHRKSKHKKKSKRKAAGEPPLMSTTAYPLYSLSGSNWAFKSGCQVSSTPQVSTLETTYPPPTSLPQAHETSYVRRSTSETEKSERLFMLPTQDPGDYQQLRQAAIIDDSPSATTPTHTRRAGLQTFSETMRRRPPAFQPLPFRIVQPTELRQPLPPPWRVKVAGAGATPTTPVFPQQQPSNPPVMPPTAPWVPHHSKPMTQLPSPALPSIITRYNVAKVFSFTPFYHPPASPQIIDKLVYAVPASSPSETAPGTPAMNKESDKGLRSAALPPPSTSTTAPTVPLESPASTFSPPSFSSSIQPGAEDSHLILSSPVSSARLGRAMQSKDKVGPLKPTPTRSVSVSMSNECTVGHSKKSSTRRVKNRSLQLQADSLKPSLVSSAPSPSDTLVAFQSSPQRLPKLISTGSVISNVGGSSTKSQTLHNEHIEGAVTNQSAASQYRGAGTKSVQRFASSEEFDASSPAPWKSASSAVPLQQRMSFATPSTAFGGVDRLGPDDWSPLEESSTENSSSSPCVAVPSVAPSASPTSVQSSPTSVQSAGLPINRSLSPERASFPTFPTVATAPGFAEFVLGLLASQRLVVEFRKDQEARNLIMSLFEGSLDHLVETREAEFASAVESKWAVQTGELAQAAKLFSQATLCQVADVQKSNWFLDDTGAPLTIQSQLLTHVYHASQPRDMFSNYFNIGTQGLDKSLDLQKHLETRRIQNAIRRFLEFSLESFLIDTCLGIKHGCLEEWESSEDVRSWVDSARVLSSELFRRPSHLSCYLRSIFAFLKEKAGRALPEDECGANAIPGEQLDAVLADLNWWPPELNLEDRREILEAISLGNSKAQHTFARQVQLPLSFDPNRPIYEEDFVAVLCSVPMNQPDFIMAAPPRNFKDLASHNQLDDILREVIRVAQNITSSVLNAKNDDSSEIQLANDRLMFSLNQHVAFQTRDSIRSRLFVAQDFLASYAVSIEELQIMALEQFPSWSSHHITTSTDSMAASQSSESSAASLNDETALLTPLEIAEEIIRASKTPGGFDFKEEILPCLQIVQLAVEYMVGLSLHAMTNSERFTVRAPLSTLAVRVDPVAVAKRYVAEPCPLPKRADCMPLERSSTETCLSKATISNASTPSYIDGAHGRAKCVIPSQCDFVTPDELVKLTRTYRKSMYARIAPAASSSWAGDETSTNEDGDWSHNEVTIPESDQRRVQVDPELMEAFVVIHSYESLREIQRLFITTESTSMSGASNISQKNAITMKNEGLKTGESQTWHEFWNQSGELASSLASHVQAGSWGPIRWNSLREIATVFSELRKRCRTVEGSALTFSNVIQP